MSARREEERDPKWRSRARFTAAAIAISALGLVAEARAEVCVSAPPPAPFGGTGDCVSPSAPTRDTLDEALATAGIDRCRAGFDRDTLALSELPEPQIFDRRRLPDFTPLHRGPLRMPAYARATRDALDGAIASKSPVSATIAALSALRGHVIARACADLSAFEPAAGDEAPLATAVALLDKRWGGAADVAALRAAAAPLPRALQERLARVIGALDHAARETRAALAPASDRRYVARSWALHLPAFDGPFAFDEGSLGALDRVDVGRMTDAAAILAKTVEEAGLQELPGASFAPFEAETPLGAIVIHDSAKDEYKRGSRAETALLLFDLGGDDVYEVPAGATDGRAPVSIAIDAHGADRYTYPIVADRADEGLLPSDRYGRRRGGTPVTRSRAGRQGSGIAGIGMLFDLGSEGDTYQSLAVSQGFAATGVGVLYDAGGDDSYAAEIGAQGAAMYGVAALIDGGGNDAFRSVTQSQGYGGARGAGALVDAAGDDVYACDVGDPALGGRVLYPWAELPNKANSSMSQGAAEGRRGIVPTGPARPPLGAGLLLYGAAALLACAELALAWRARVRAAGEPRALARLRWIVPSVLALGAVAHAAYTGLASLVVNLFPIRSGHGVIALSAIVLAVAYPLLRRRRSLPALGVLLGLLGLAGLGATHTLTKPSRLAGGVGVLRDRRGNDRYTGSAFAQGVGYWQGLGMFLEGGGDDQYDTIWYGQGAAAHFALAIFIEEGGSDAYNQRVLPLGMASGAGHDFSAGLHLDEGGDDRYRAPRLSLGTGNWNGLGLFVNSGGDDRYEVTEEPSLGTGNNSAASPFESTRKSAPTIGIFVDAGGRDAYRVVGAERPLDESTWSRSPQPYPAPLRVEAQRSGGVDRAAGTVTLP